MVSDQMQTLWQSATSAPSRVAYIDTWRVLAVGFVIAAHLTLNPQLDAISKENMLLQFITGYGQVGVFIFFFISGFIVSKTCFDELKKRGSFSIVGFYIRRAFRIIPPLLIYLFSCTILSFVGIIQFSRENFFSASIYLCNTTLSFIDCGWYAGHTWSLAFEEQFYLCFPLFFSFRTTKIFSFRTEKRNTERLLIAIVGTIALIPFLFSIPWVGKSGFIVIYSLFFVGFILAEKFIYFERLEKSPYLIICAIISTLIVFFPTWYFHSLNFSKYHKFLLIVAVPLMVLATGIKGRILERIFSVGAISYVGRATYSIYLWQQLFCGEPFSRLQPASQLLVMGIMIFFCILMFETIERRLIKLGRQISNSI
jgi:peptidoglycan/LPS O-acetylase OafA/YrhL